MPESIYIPLCIYFNDYIALTALITAIFTFHYVSISTFIPALVALISSVFTFHYVSISTDLDEAGLPF